MLSRMSRLLPSNIYLCRYLSYNYGRPGDLFPESRGPETVVFTTPQVPRKKYDVFISFRGLDVRHRFLSHLTEKFRQKNINVSMNEILERGDEISSGLLAAIENSEIALVIFSKDYASSTGRLEELVKIMECMRVHHQRVIPIFYDVDPSQVRYQRGSYAGAFAQHEQNFKNNLMKLQDWRYALKETADLFGYHFSRFSNESNLIDEIVKQASKRIFASKKYDIFISFRGSDVRYGFLSHLTKQLRHEGIDVYVDERLDRGDEISTALLKAIERSKIALVIFSKDYASSRWCLDELMKIMECKRFSDQIVIPVFYHVDPSHVRKQEGSYAEAFAQHEQKFKHDLMKLQDWRSVEKETAEKLKKDLIKLQGWTCVLKETADLSGHHSSNFLKEPDLIDGIIIDVQRKLEDEAKLGLSYY
ncbi:hypothetical protein QN277_022394 [Acacia crassicarpa]|uniref:ADP-ribosyl cyclase/cyclic ADP-ribose hydrolase n=1 Tax=Acacia crassicarpa TaxID=499986 RepID=A0AAE1JHP4_9FABA|nr:hypothetical protein QN277_022394 [Acacia crassicarpa]